MQEQDYADINPMRDLESAEHCDDCGAPVEWYWARDELWYSVAHVDNWLCLRCFGRRLGHQITPADLSPSAPINRKPDLLERVSIPYGYCYCNCGRKTEIAKKTYRAQGQVKGEPNRYLAGHKASKRPDYIEEDRGYNTACWIWQGGKDRTGYGLVNRPEHRGAAHIWYYKTMVGPIPEGLELDHLCRVRECVNPEHFEAVTHEENVKRGLSPAAANARKTHCIHGHPFDAENTYIRPNGMRQCRICQREQIRAWHEKKKAAARKS